MTAKSATSLEREKQWRRQEPLDSALAPRRHHLAACKLVKRYLSLNTGFPFFSAQYVAAHIERPETARAELDEYKRTHSRTMSVVRGAMVISSCLYFCRIISLPAVVLYETNYNNLTENLRWHSESLNQFSCVLTNCHQRRVAARELAQSLSELPLFTLCHPQLAQLHHLLQYLDVHGVLLAVVFGFSILLSGAILPLVNWLAPTGNLVLMFIVAPRVTRRVVQDRARRLVEELERSRGHFGDQFALIELEQNQQRRELAELDFTDDHLLKLERSLELELELELNLSSSAASRLNLIGADNAKQPQLLGGRLACAPRLLSASLERPYVSGGARLQVAGLEPRFLQGAADIAAREPFAARQPFAAREPFAAPSPHSHDNRPPAYRRDSLRAASARDRYLERFTRDCVTMMRSRWWRAKAAQALSTMLYANGISLLLWVVFIALSLIKLAKDRRELFRNFAHHLHSRWGCDVWVAGGNATGELLAAGAAGGSAGERLLASSAPLNLETIEVPVPIARYLLAIAQTIWPLGCIAFFFLIYLLTNAELICWLHELKFGLTLGAEFVRQLKQRPVASARGAPPPPPQAHQLTSKPPTRLQLFDMDILRRPAARLLGVNLFTARQRLLGRRRQQQQGGQAGAASHTNSKLEHALAVAEFVANAIERHQLDLAAACELLEKLYVNFRIYVEHVGHYGRVMTVMLTFINLYTYGFVLIGVFFVRSIENFVLVPFALMIFNWISANLVILVASNLHAKAKGLHALIWSLVAVTGDCADLKLNHMRALWLKQVQAIDMDGGLALKAFGVRITYVRIIQLVIGSGTLVVFVLRA